ncbi:MAG: hypothetical protein BWY82_02860 [Verrucomicrobia bacterium ADurb.Bin474]|nr:MAG: hypothetical protein BWY82_02860 [Verrucomicrobia bacterium ADurb.Bin474]
MAEDLKRIGKQTIAGKDRRRLIECHVTSGLPAAQRTIIHRGKIVMDQAVGVHQLNRNRGWKRVCDAIEHFMGAHQHEWS